ncbi:hypothetical protein HPULCUR_009973 [Helicostylum pulchrum]|uniref:Protein kinase domain-containing protein n=1 Tax=Helicostylum pulchrum TaxID=562976 RepID=A0ABP9YBY6_9FUNG
MFLSRLNSNKPLNEEDPLLLYEQVIGQYTEMNEYTLDLLKTVIIKYKDDTRYKNSPRYLRLWLTYIIYLNVPQFILPILCSLIDNNIGDKLATFQLDWIDVELQHSIRTGVLRECNHKHKCFEELRAGANNYIFDGRRQRFPRVLPNYGFYQYLDKSYILMAYVQTGTLLDVLNLYRTKQQSSCMSEPIVLLFILQLLKQIEALHRIHITHNDLKLDNVMLGMRKNPKKFPALIIIDYGYSVDLLALENQDCNTCKATWSPACPQSDYPLLNTAYHPIHADYWQLATMAHLLLFGLPMRYTATITKQITTYRIQQTIKRYWHKQLWLHFFEFLLNPQTNDLSALIQEFKTESDTIQSKIVQDFITFLFP